MIETLFITVLFGFWTVFVGVVFYRLGKKHGQELTEFRELDY